MYDQGFYWNGDWGKVYFVLLRGVWVGVGVGLLGSVAGLVNVGIMGQAWWVGKKGMRVKWW